MQYLPCQISLCNSLKAHRIIHTDDKHVFQCELCPTTSDRKTGVRIHVQKLHTSEKTLQHFVDQISEELEVDDGGVPVVLQQVPVHYEGWLCPQHLDIGSV